jgi:hypothetical protein
MMAGNLGRDREADMKMLEMMFFANLERGNCEYGGIGLNDKRPFGNGDVEGDILEAIGADMEGDDGEYDCWSSGQHEYAASLYDGLIGWLQGRYLVSLEEEI